MTAPAVARTTRRDMRDYAVHAVDVDLAQFGSAFDLAVLAEVFATRPTEAVLPRQRTLCGEPVPRLVALDPHERVTCAECLAALGGPAVTEALLVLVEARRPGRVTA